MLLFWDIFCCWHVLSFLMLFVRKDEATVLLLIDGCCLEEDEIIGFDKCFIEIVLVDFGIDVDDEWLSMWLLFATIWEVEGCFVALEEEEEDEEASCGEEPGTVGIVFYLIYIYILLYLYYYYYYY